MRDDAEPPSLRIDAASRHVRLSPRDDQFVQDPYPAYRAIRRACPLFFWEDYGHWCLADHPRVSAMFRDRRFGRDLAPVSARAGLATEPHPDHLKPFYDFESRSMLESEPPTHTRLRNLVNRAFVSRHVERMRPRIEALAHRLVDAMAGPDPVDLLGAFAEPIPVEVIAEMLGIPLAMAPQLLDWSHRMVAMYQFGRTREIEDEAVSATRAFSDFIRSLLPARRRQEAEDILSLLLAATEDGDRLSEDELVTNAILLLNAGHEATVHGIGNAVAVILASGHDPGSLFATPEHTRATIEELLRFDPPLHMFTRYALQPVDIDGVTFKTGDRIGLLIGAANHDPLLVPDPDRFDPTRAPAPHVAFGGGIHFCVGAPLARLELAIALPILFARLPALRLIETPRYADRFHFHGLQTLRVEPGPATPPHGRDAAGCRPL